MNDKKVTAVQLAKMKGEGEKIACLTVYDATFARVLEAAGVDVLLVGDSLGMVVQGFDNTLPVSVRDMVYHCRNVARGSSRALVLADMPFMSYTDRFRALRTAGRLIKAGAQMVKLEGGSPQVETVRALVANGIPVCGHLGLLPQSVHKLGGYPVQGRNPAAAEAIRADALALEQAGASLLVLESVPSDLAGWVSRDLSIPVIGIGAGAACDGQVLVLYDMLGVTGGRVPRFVKNFLPREGSVESAVRAYVDAVKTGAFPGAEHTYQ